MPKPYNLEGPTARQIMEIERTSVKTYMAEIGDSQPLSGEEERELARRYKLGDIKARNKLVYSNLRFVISVAREHDGRGLELSDLISSGNIGLITAAERFDETLGFKFISYAVWWIRQAILQALADSRVVRLPLNRIDLINRIHKAQSQGSTDLSDIADKLSINPERVSGLLTDSQRVLSLDATFDGDTEKNLYSFLQDDEQKTPEEDYETARLKEEIGRVLETLDLREAEVIDLYFGLSSGEGMSLEEIGTRFGLTRERIRQIKEKALVKLRHSSRSRPLKPYADELN